MARWGRTLVGAVVGGLVLVAGLVVVAPPPAAEALADACQVRQVTDTEVPGPRGVNPVVGGARITADGQHVLFVMAHDLVGANPDGGPEVFDYDVASGALSQLTDFPDAAVLRNLDVDGDASVITFLAGLTTPDNPDGSNEVFVWDRDADELTAVTDGWVGVFLSLRIDDAGDRLIFNDGRTDADNPDGGHELWLHDRSEGTSQPLTSDGVGLVNDAAISGDGTTVAYLDWRDPLGTNADGSAEVFVARPDTDTLVQATDVDGAPSVHDVAVDHDGDAVAVVSTAQLDPTADRRQAHLSVVDPWTGTAEQVAANGGTETYIQFPGISADGTRVAAFAEHSADFRFNVTSIYDVATGDAAIAIAESGIRSVDLGATGDRLAVLTNANPTGENADGSVELFFAVCPTFRDVLPSHPFAADVEWFAAQGVADGYGDGTFRPASVVSRQAAWAFIYRLAGSPAVGLPATPTFSDVPLSHTFSTEIEWAVARGVTRGFSDGTFRPALPVTRQALAAFLHRTAGEPAVTPPAEPTFPDVAEDHPFFLEIEWAAAAGLTQGYADGTFRPGARVTRQAAAAMLHRLVDGPGVGL